MDRVDGSRHVEGHFLQRPDVQASSLSPPSSGVIAGTEVAKTNDTPLGVLSVFAEAVRLPGMRQLYCSDIWTRTNLLYHQAWCAEVVGLAASFVAMNSLMASLLGSPR